MPLHGLSILFPTETEGFRRSALTPRCDVSSNKTSEDGRLHHRESRPQMWEKASHPPETGAHGVPPRQPRSLSDEGNFGETEVSALTSSPGSLIRKIESSSRGSTLVEGYRDALTRPRAFPHNVLLPFPPLHAPVSSLKPHPGKNGWRVAPGQPAPFHSLKHRSSQPQNHWPSISDAVGTGPPLANDTHLFRSTCFPMPR
ncbi:hypothetical protein TcCL_NonESM10161 [Trypanosoma cruzi]|nr:hypothetical protein TcCL_NonESM10161 [Trypanosoma cruzi]